MALQVMVWFNFVSLFFWPSSFTLPNILRAAGDARVTMAVSILFFAVPILLGIPAFCMYQQAQCASAQKPNQQVKGHKAGQSVSERHCHAIPQVQEFRGKIRPG